jgi:hypothetical protein
VGSVGALVSDPQPIAAAAMAARHTRRPRDLIMRAPRRRPDDSRPRPCPQTDNLLALTIASEWTEVLSERIHPPGVWTTNACRRRLRPGAAPVRQPDHFRLVRPILKRRIFENQYWIYPTYSAPYNDQLFLDAFSSPDLVTWTKHERVLDAKNIAWAKRAVWAPTIVKKGEWYYLFFAANDIQNDQQLAASASPSRGKPEALRRSSR